MPPGICDIHVPGGRAGKLHVICLGQCFIKKKKNFVQQRGGEVNGRQHVSEGYNSTFSLGQEVPMAKGPELKKSEFQEFITCHLLPYMLNVYEA